jgi:GT2 family glycosyltransferase
LPKISVIIPHAGGAAILQQCLASLGASQSVQFETIIVDNGSSEALKRNDCTKHIEVQILHFKCKLGFAAACNRGVEAANSDYVFLLNNDATVEPDTLKTLSDLLDRSPELGACQPKILSLANPGCFDYSSASGGEMDRYGFPFARGRIFETVEQDRGQYEDTREVFWGAGSALMLRRRLYLDAGGLEEPFFAHMEEIDLLWRIQLMGFRVVAHPAAIVRHLGAATIRSGSFAKMYLNQRNSLAMLFRNYGICSLIKYLPGRLIFDLILLTVSLFQINFERLWSVLRADLWFWASLPYLVKGRIRVQRLRSTPERTILNRIYPKSIVWQYFVQKRRTWREVMSVV